jgi:hypothetical protein
MLMKGPTFQSGFARESNVKAPIAVSIMADNETTLNFNLNDAKNDGYVFGDLLHEFDSTVIPSTTFMRYFYDRASSGRNWMNRLPTLPGNCLSSQFEEGLRAGWGEAVTEEVNKQLLLWVSMLILVVTLAICLTLAFTGGRDGVFMVAIGTWVTIAQAFSFSVWLSQ